MLCYTIHETTQPTNKIKQDCRIHVHADQYKLYFVMRPSHADIMRSDAASVGMPVICDLLAGSTHITATALPVKADKPPLLALLESVH